MPSLVEIGPLVLEKKSIAVMRLDMGTINSFCLDDGVRKNFWHTHVRLPLNC